MAKWKCSKCKDVAEIEREISELYCCSCGELRIKEKPIIKGEINK